jgi:hypothetical protein
LSTGDTTTTGQGKIYGTGQTGTTESCDELR